MTFPRRRPPTPPDDDRSRLSRRSFLVVGGGAAAGSLLVGACSDDAGDGGVSGPASSSTTAPTDRARRFFTPFEAALVEAATARILPGTPDDPGAREAEVVVYIDGLLATGGWGSEPVYRAGPFPSPDQVGVEGPDGGEGGDGDTSGSGEPSEGGDGGDTDLGTTSFGVVRRPIGTLDRYGDQSPLSPAEVYRMALPAMDAQARASLGAGFLELDDPGQDLVLAAMEEGTAEAFEVPSGEDLFALLRQHTLEGMFSDPIYGGNRGMVGWSLIGWPAAQRAYTIVELQTPSPPRPPQGIEDLPHGRGNIADRDEPVLPLAGSDQRRQHGEHR